MMQFLQPLLRLGAIGLALVVGGCGTMEVRNPVCTVQQDYLFDRINSHEDPLCLQHYVDEIDSTYNMPPRDLGDGTKVSIDGVTTESKADTTNETTHRKTTTTTTTTQILVTFSKIVPPPPAQANASGYLESTIQIADRRISLKKVDGETQQVLIESIASGNNSGERRNVVATPEKRKALLLAMYQTAASYCLYYKNKGAFVYKLGVNFYNFGDVLVAAAVPVAAFSHATPETIALISGLVTILGSPLKAAMGSVDPGQDYSTTTNGMQTVYDLFNNSDSFVNHPDPTVDPKAMFSIYRTGLEQTCFSTLTFGSGKSETTKPNSNNNKNSNDNGNKNG